MKIEKCMKKGFCVIGKEGSTNDGAGFVQALWQDANGHFDQVAPLAKKDEQGNLVGIWGAMSDLNRRFLRVVLSRVFSHFFTKGVLLTPLM